MGTSTSGKELKQNQIKMYQRTIEKYRDEIANKRELMKDPHNKNNVSSYKYFIESRQKEIKQYQDIIKRLRAEIQRMK